MAWRRALVAAVFACTAAPQAAIGAPPDVVRVGGPYKPGDAKVAIVATQRAVAGRAFRVVDAQGLTVLSGRLRRAPGSPAPWRHGATADFTALSAEGTYRAVVGARRSRPFVVRATGTADAVATILRFFAANSDGTEPSPLHAPSHLNDALVASGPYRGQRFDLTGGWMDAGDMIHFTKTTAFAAIALQLAARVDAENATQLDAAADVGIRWLVKAHPAADLFIQQVADGRDHAEPFRDPAGDDASPKPGIGQRLAYPGIGADVGGKAAAALALAAARTANPGLLQQAREWYAAGTAAEAVLGWPQGLVGEFFYNAADEGEGRDDLATAAVFLWRATGEPQFLEDARRYLPSVATSAPSWSETGLLGAADLCGGAGLPPAADAALAVLACGKLHAAARLAAAFGRQRAFPAFGPHQWGTTGTNAAGAAIAGMAARAGILPSGAALADGGRDWLLGRNPWGVSFVVGYGPGAPRRPHHWAAAYRGRGEPVGAVVGGPAPREQVNAQRRNFSPRFRERAFNSSRLVYEDNAGDYVTSEPAIDYAAAAILNLAVASSS